MHNATNSSTPLRLTVRGAQKDAPNRVVCASLHPGFNGGGGARTAKGEDTFTTIPAIFEDSGAW